MTDDRPPGIQTEFPIPSLDEEACRPEGFKNVDLSEIWDAYHCANTGSRQFGWARRYGKELVAYGRSLELKDETMGEFLPACCEKKSELSEYIDELEDQVRRLKIELDHWRKFSEERHAVEGLAFVNGKWQQFPTEHFVTFQGEDFFVAHPLSCRLDGLPDCQVHAWISSFDSSPADPGFYRVVQADDQFALVPEQTTETVDRCIYTHCSLTREHAHDGVVAVWANDSD